MACYAKLRVRLKEDLTRYHPNAKEGALGWTLPEVQCSMWGTYDRFWAVQFDEGGRLDLLSKGLEVIDHPDTVTP